MHFVKKVPTSEEEKAAKKKEHDKRSKQYLHVRDRIVAKREKGEYDDEIMSLTQQILEKNADIYTFWNIRRTTIEKRISENHEIQGNHSVSAEEKTNSQKSLDKLLDGELFLSYECIKGNPKSYSSWFQRAWVLERQSNPDFEKELALCQKALQLDCRNFHCWDHRRTVAKMAKRTEAQELEFSNKLIEDNFSNYSAWHYRAISIQKLQFEKKTGDLKLDDETIASELEFVKSAFYIDAEDQSAWTYTRWLLEVGSGKEFLRPESSTPITLISASFHGNNTTLVFSRAVTIDLLLTFVDTEDRTRWRAFSSTSPNPTSSRVWQYLSDTPPRVVTSQNSEFSDISSERFVNENILQKIYDVAPIGIPKSINTLLEDCKNLIDLEPNNKWPLYMRTLVLMEYDPVNSHAEIVQNLTKLASELDVNRQELYKSVLSRQNLNLAVRENETLAKLISGETDQLAARYKNLTSLEGIEYLSGLVGSADFAGNQLTDVSRIVLPNLQNVTLDENPIKRLSPSPSFSHLKFISLANTEISSVEDIMPCLQQTPSLERIVFCETGLVAKTEELRAQLPGVRLIPHWL